jgi:hypothetical protein
MVQEWLYHIYSCITNNLHFLESHHMCDTRRWKLSHCFCSLYRCPYIGICDNSWRVQYFCRFSPRRSATYRTIKYQVRCPARVICVTHFPIHMLEQDVSETIQTLANWDESLWGRCWGVFGQQRCEFVLAYIACNEKVDGLNAGMRLARTGNMRRSSIVWCIVRSTQGHALMFSMNSHTGYDHI